MKVFLVADEMSEIDVTIVIVSYNTCDMTLACLRSVARFAPRTAHEVIVLDNASTDGSADAVAAEFPQIRLVRLTTNVGFAAGNNIASRWARGRYILFLNPDTELLEGSVDNLLAHAKAHPEAGAWGGRTVFADGTLNASSLRAFMSLRGLAFSALGLSAIFRSSPFFNPDPYPRFARDGDREVDILFFCFVLMRTETWRRLGGFDLRYFMFCEDDDLCMRLRRAGLGARFTPSAQVIHHGGASIPRSARRQSAILKGRITFAERHWSARKAALARVLLLAAVATRVVATTPTRSSRRAMWRELWKNRAEWLTSYPERRAASADVLLADGGTVS